MANVHQVNTFSFRLQRKLQEHFAADPTGWSFFKYAAKWFFMKLRRKGNELFIRQPQISDNGDLVKIAVKITGGLGDYIVLGRILKNLLAVIENAECYIFVPNTEYAEWIFKNVPEVKEIYPEIFWDKCRQNCDCSLFLNTFVFFDEQNVNIQKIKKVAPRLLEIFSNTVRNHSIWTIYIENHPVLDGAFARQAVVLGYNRYSFINHCLGIQCSGYSFDLPLCNEEAMSVAAKFPQYVTVNAGFDHQFVISSRFATKCYPVEYWEALVKLIKDNFPRIGVVQIGGKNSPSINGCDIHYEKKLSLSQSAGILKKSLLHIDIEGGLVHICAALGTKCAVLFGPTSKKYFSYTKNLNILAGECHDCWWATERWMECCPGKKERNECMYKLMPELVFEKIKPELDKFNNL